MVTVWIFSTGAAGVDTDFLQGSPGFTFEVFMNAHVFSLDSTLRRACAIVALGVLAAGCNTAVQPVNEWPTGDNPDGGSGGCPPSDVQKVFADHCTSCHGSPTSGGAPMSLVTLADLTKKSYIDATASFAARSVLRMQAMTMPPAPATQATAAEIKVLSDWIASGMPEGTCGVQKPDPLNAAPTCTSGTMWTRGNHGSDDMNPGLACIDCHSRMKGPTFRIGGTLFPTGHEPDLCNGASNSVDLSAAVVVIKGANGTEFMLSVSGTSGNFFLERGALTLPYTAKVVLNGKERAMNASQTSGDCNSCHTQAGSYPAPGRITIPVQ